MATDQEKKVIFPQEDASSKVRVYAKAQNRTALGIMHAYMLINPNATIDDLREAFPDSLNPDSGVKQNFKLKEQQVGSANWNGYFMADEELIETRDGSHVAVVSMWTAPSLQRLVNRAHQYGIIVAEYEAATKGFGHKGRFSLEYLNSFTPGAVIAPKKSNKAVYWIATAVAAGAIATGVYTCNGAKVLTDEAKEAIQDKVEEVAEEQLDSLVQKQFSDLETEYNNLHFAKGSVEINAQEADATLSKLATALKTHPEAKLTVVGHASEEGDATANQRLSEQRAAAVISALRAKGVEASQLKSEGRGSSMPIDSATPEKNRRVEFVVSK